jgi:formylglycine-generating enzyme required for sulfatase activity
MNPFPSPFPPVWATAWGEDRYGLYAEFEVGGVVQVCRWIPPGQFLMGSPEDEAGRWENEGPQHEVTLSGFWLADTACTQALWQAVMGKNPANFQSNEQNPVEQVSWNDCSAFFEKLNQMLPELAAWFPTEAKWEYACRAGTTTPFSFGANIMPEQVNYQGDFPYAGGTRGVYRQKTVPVASLPANGWGLYEMHGNVLEWCADWFGDYAAVPQTDPEGPSQGPGRVLRGGSWFNDGPIVRSAYRHHVAPGYRYDSFGLRLSPGRRA